MVHVSRAGMPPSALACNRAISLRGEGLRWGGHAHLCSHVCCTDRQLLLRAAGANGGRWRACAVWWVFRGAKRVRAAGAGRGGGLPDQAPRLCAHGAAPRRRPGAGVRVWPDRHVCVGAHGPARRARQARGAHLAVDGLRADAHVRHRRHAHAQAGPDHHRAGCVFRPPPRRLGDVCSELLLPLPLPTALLLPVRACCLWPRVEQSPARALFIPLPASSASPWPSFSREPPPLHAWYAFSRGSPVHARCTRAGKPIQLPQLDNPSDEEVDKYLRTFCAEMRRIFETHKKAAGYPDLKLTIL